MTDYKNKFEEIIKNSKKIAITSHIGPDRDSILSCLSLYYYLKIYFKLDAEILYEGTSTDWIDNIENSKSIKWVDDIANHLNEYDTWIFLDASEMSRFSQIDFSKKIVNTKTICFDHHPQSPDFELDLYYKDGNKAGTAHLLGQDIIDREFLLKDRLLSEYILAGILGDTGILKYISKSWAPVLPFIQILLETHNFQIEAVAKKFIIKSKKDLIIIQEFLKNTQYATHKNGQNFMYSFLSQEFKDKYEFSDADIKSGKSLYLAEYIRGVSDYPFGFAVTPTDFSYSISFRSDPNYIDVNKLAKHFNGGGHPLAAGGQIDKKDGDNIDKAIKQILEIFNSVDLQRPE